MRRHSTIAAVAIGAFVFVFGFVIPVAVPRAAKFYRDGTVAKQLQPPQKAKQPELKPCVLGADGRTYTCGFEEAAKDTCQYSYVTHAPGERSYCSGGKWYYDYAEHYRYQAEVKERNRLIAAFGTRILTDKEFDYILDYGPTFLVSDEQSYSESVVTRRYIELIVKQLRLQIAAVKK